MNRRYPLRILVWAMAIVAITLVVFGTSMAVSSDHHSLDQRVVSALRDPTRPGQLIGPPALQEAMRDFTGLGGYAILIVLIVTFSFSLRFHVNPGSGWFFAITCISGYVCGEVLKELVKRGRPDHVPQLSYVASQSESFPSSHSMMSAVTLMSIGIMLASMTDHRRLRLMLQLTPLLLTLLVGVSRVCMGVHYPSDVLAGWLIGLAWTWSAFRIREWQESHGADPSDSGQVPA